MLRNDHGDLSSTMHPEEWQQFAVPQHIDESLAARLEIRDDLWIHHPNAPRPTNQPNDPGSGPRNPERLTVDAFAAHVFPSARPRAIAATRRAAPGSPSMR